MRDLQILRTITSAVTKSAAQARPPAVRGGGRTVLESFTGAWQQNVEVKTGDVLAHPTAFRCINLISSDIAKLRVRLVKQDDNGIWEETKNSAYSPVLRKPNGFQTRIQFFESWMVSKLIDGNTYVLKVRDGRGVVIKLYVLDPKRVQALVAPDGSVFYKLLTDDISGLQQDISVPAREMIHDRINCIHHPLVGTSPIYACGLAATQGLRIQENSAVFFANGSRPSGVLTGAGEISQETADELRDNWHSNFAGKNSGKIAVLGDGLTYQAMHVSPHDAQLIEQLRWSAETVCSAFGVPAYKLGVGTPPSHDNVEAMDAQYYAQCLQRHIEDIELLLDEGLGMPEGTGTEFDLDDLLRMDSKTLMELLDKGKSIMTPDEQRRRIGLKPTPGGDQVYRQQQDYSLAALAKRDNKDDPFSTDDAEPDPAANDNEDEEDVAEAQARDLLDAFTKGLS